MPGQEPQQLGTLPTFDRTSVRMHCSGCGIANTIDPGIAGLRHHCGGTWEWDSEDLQVDPTAPQTSSSSESKPEAESLGSTRAALTGHQRRVMIECRFNAEYAASPGLTDIDLAYRLKLNHSHARGLRGQLVKLGLLRDSGTKRAGLTKIKATVWVLTEKGINA